MMTLSMLMIMIKADRRYNDDFDPITALVFIICDDCSDIATDITERRYHKYMLDINWDTL